MEGIRPLLFYLAVCGSNELKYPDYLEASKMVGRLRAGMSRSEIKIAQLEKQISDVEKLQFKTGLVKEWDLKWLTQQLEEELVTLYFLRNNHRNLNKLVTEQREIHGDIKPTHSRKQFIRRLKS